MLYKIFYQRFFGNLHNYFFGYQFNMAAVGFAQVECPSINVKIKI
jgi:hypothetical protein